MNITLHAYYLLINEFVKFYPPQTLVCDWPQTFAVLDEKTDINTPNLAKTILDVNKPFFFSRKWASANYNPSNLEYDYPLIATFEPNFSILNPFKGNSERCYELELMFVDKYHKNCIDKGSKCGNGCIRTRSEIYADTEKLMNDFFRYMQDIVLVQGKLFMHKKIAEELYPANEIDLSFSRRFIIELDKLNESLNAYRYDGGVDDLYGTIVNIKLPVSFCPSLPFEPHFIEFKQGYDRPCC